MLKWVAVMAAALLAPQAKNTNPDLHYNEAQGISVMKPTKSDEWEFKTENGRLKGTKVIVAHRVDDLTIEVVYEEPVQNTGLNISSFDIKKAAESLYDNLAAGENLKDAVKKESKGAKLPGNGAGGVNAHFVELTIKNKADKSYEVKIWAFVGKENQSLYRIVFWSEPGLYKKHQRTVEYILGSIKTWKLPKKK